MKATPLSSSERTLPPDAGLEALASLINEKAPYGRVNFFIREVDDGPLQYGIIYQARSKRATVMLRNRPTEHEVPDILEALKAWAGEDRGAQYTTELPDDLKPSRSLETWAY